MEALRGDPHDPGESRVPVPDGDHALGAPRVLRAGCALAQALERYGRQNFNTRGHFWTECSAHGCRTLTV